MTKYRIVNETGRRYYLEYERETKGFFRTKRTWEKVWKPYFDEFYGRWDFDGFGDYNLYINDSVEEPLIKFTQIYPDISLYFTIAELEQKLLEEKVREKIAKIESKKGIKYI